MPEPLRTLSRRTLTVGLLSAVAALGASVVARRDPDLTASGVPGPDPARTGTRAARSTTRPAPTPTSTPTTTPTPSTSPTPAATELPRGGRTLFPRHRVVAYAGLPGSPALGRLGIGDLGDRTAELERVAARYATDGVEPLPALELISVVVQSRPGPDGTYRVRVDEDVVDAHLAAAREARALLLLNIQPGKARFLDEVRAHERWLREPDVGLALDPEWAVRGRGRPGQVFGRTDGDELDTVSAWVSDLVAEHDLPEKLMVVHVLSPTVLRGASGLRRRPGVAVVRCADGIGTPAQKRSSWRRVQAGGAQPDATAGAGVMATGFKLFYEEDTEGSSRLMKPAEVLALTPTPVYVCYE